jgi:hypothetical protein
MAGSWREYPHAFKNISEKAKVFLTCADINEEQYAAPDYRGRYKGN